MIKIALIVFCAVFSYSLAVNVQCPKEDSELAVYFPAEKCNAYYECSNGVPHLIQCPTGLLFNSKLNVCDWPENVECNEVQCPEIDGYMPVYLPGPVCEQFYECSNGVPYLLDCPAKLQFNTDLNVCVWPADSNCTNNSTDIPA